MLSELDEQTRHEIGAFILTSKGNSTTIWAMGIVMAVIGIPLTWGIANGTLSAWYFFVLPALGFFAAVMGMVVVKNK